MIGLLEAINVNLIPFVFAVTFLFYIAGFVQFFFFNDNDESRQSGKKKMVSSFYGLLYTILIWLVLRVMLSLLAL